MQNFGCMAHLVRTSATRWRMTLDVGCVESECVCWGERVCWNAVGVGGGVESEKSGSAVRRIVEVAADAVRCTPCAVGP